MKKTILIFLLRTLILLLVATAAIALNFTMYWILSLLNAKFEKPDVFTDLLTGEIGISILIGVPYLLSLFIFELIRIKRTSTKVKGIFIALIISLFIFLVGNAFTIVRPSIFDVSILIPFIAFSIGGFSLPFVDEFFMKKFRLKESE